MGVYKDKSNNTWRVVFRYTDWTGEVKQTQKRGFQTKREAVAWEHEQMVKRESKLDMTFASFVQSYEEDVRKRMKENTWHTKEHIIRTKLMPYFGKLKMNDITARHIIRWQNEMMNRVDEKGEHYSQVYLRTLNSQELICKG